MHLTKSEIRKTLRLISSALLRGENASAQIDGWRVTGRRVYKQPGQTGYAWTVDIYCERPGHWNMSGGVEEITERIHAINKNGYPAAEKAHYQERFRGGEPKRCMFN
jgi:hypothetical protein